MTFEDPNFLFSAESMRQHLASASHVCDKGLSPTKGFCLLDWRRLFDELFIVRRFVIKCRWETYVIEGMDLMLS